MKKEFEALRATESEKEMFIADLTQQKSIIESYKSNLELIMFEKQEAIKENKEIELKKDRIYEKYQSLLRSYE